MGSGHCTAYRFGSFVLDLERGALLAAHGEEPINRALRELGVVATGGYDEFDSFGFGGVRSNRDIVENWIEVIPPTPRAPKG